VTFITSGQKAGWAYTPQTWTESWVGLHTADMDRKLGGLTHRRYGQKAGWAYTPQIWTESWVGLHTADMDRKLGGLTHRRYGPSGVSKNLRNAANQTVGLR